LRRLSLFLVLGLVIISLVGCGEIKTQEKATADNNKVAVEDSEKAKESKGATTEKVGLVLKSEKLHNSDNQPPEKSVLVKTQEEIIKDIDQPKLIISRGMPFNKGKKYFQSKYTSIPVIT